MCDFKTNRQTLDIRYQPLYTIPEVASYARVNPSTLRTWAESRHCANGRDSRYPAVIRAASPTQPDKLSFINLIEAHILTALRQSHQVPLSKIRTAVTWLRDNTTSKHPLAELDIQTDGLNVFIRHVGQIVCASERGQIVLREVVERFLRRIERDAQGLPIQFFPFTYDAVDADCPKVVMIDPSVAFGRPVVRGTRISTSIVFERYKAGEGLVEIAQDYDLELKYVEEALRCEIECRAA